MRFAVITKNRLLVWVSVALSITLLVIAVITTGSYVLASGKTTRKLPIYCVDREDGKVAITFDASWGADSTDAILETVKQYGIKATFFTVSIWAEKYPGKLKAISDSGVFEIGLHSSTHPRMSKLTRSQMQEELSGNLATVERITGQVSTIFRPPFGDYSDTLIEVAENMGLKTVQWDVDSLDWKGLSAGEIAGRVLAKARSGSIILLHNDGKNTAKALPAIIEGLKNNGLQPVTVSELIYHEDYTVDHTGKQIKNT